MRRSDIVDGELLVIQEKTGTELYLPVIPELEQALRAYLAKGLALIGNENDAPLTRARLSSLIGVPSNELACPARAKPKRRAELRA